jgi:hypothetical protein
MATQTGMTRCTSRVVTVPRSVFLAAINSAPCFDSRIWPSVIRRITTNRTSASAEA